MVVIVGMTTDQITRSLLAESSAHSPMSHLVLGDEIERVRWIARGIYLFLFGIGAYILVGFTLKSIREASVLQKNFIKNIAHELRTPLTISKTETESGLRKADSLSKEQLTALLRENLHQINHVSEIINFLVTISDIGSDNKHRSLRPVSLMQVIANAVQGLSHLYTKREMALKKELPASDLIIQGNPIALEKMISNLLTNAANHSSQGGTVRVTLESACRGPILRVIDTGTGINHKDLAHIFEPFYRGGSAQGRGSGLGLALVQEIAKMHNAKISVDSQEGKGTVFSVQFLQIG